MANNNDFEKCTKIYTAMKAASKHITRDGFTGDVYQGRLTFLFSEEGISVPYYTSIMNALKEMGCVQQIRRGGGTAQSEWALFYEPTEAEFDKVEKKSSRLGSRQPKTDQLAQQNRDTAALVNDLERRVKLLEMILTHDRGKTPEELILELAEEELDGNNG
jgi:hypothetical protein